MSAGTSSPASAGTSELLVLVDEAGHAVGTAPKPDVHHADTPLHLAFSCYVFDASGRLLVTQRALDKPTWPGAWTNSCCGHPGPGENVEAACRRRVGQELGLGLADLRLVLPRFRYRAVMPNGVVENELCPVLVATSDEAVDADPTEVAAYAWVDWPGFRDDVLAGRRAVSPWCVEQVAALPDDPLAAPPADRGLLPPAAR